MNQRSFRLWKIGMINHVSEPDYSSLTLMLFVLSITLSFTKMPGDFTIRFMVAGLMFTFSINKAKDDTAQDTVDEAEENPSPAHQLQLGHALINQQPYLANWFGWPPNRVQWFPVKRLKALPQLPHRPTFVIDDPTRDKS